MPHGIWRCAAETDPAGQPDDDRWLAIAVLDDEAWQRCRGARGQMAEWAARPELRTLGGRIAARAEIDVVSPRGRGRGAEDLEARLQAGVAAGLVANGADLARDAQLRGAQTTSRPSRRRRAAARPSTASRSGPRRRSWTVAAPGPLLGEHTDLVLRDLLGLREADLATSGPKE